MINMRFRIRRKWMMSGLMITLSFLFLLFLFPAAAQETADQNVLKEQPAAGEAQSLIQGPVSMEVEYGYHDIAKGGRYVPVNVFLTNGTDKPFKGSITISTMESDQEVYSYEYPVEAEAGASVEESYIVAFGKGSDQVFVVLKDEAGRQTAKKRLKMDVNREVPEMFVGILSDTPERLAYLDGAGISYSAVQTRTISLSKDEFPEDMIGLDLFDVLLVSNYRLRDLSERQTKAIMDWVRDGGVLVLGTGNRIDDTLGRFAPELLDDNYDMPISMDIHLGGEEGGQSVLMKDIPCADIPLHGGDVLESENGIPLFQAASQEKGIIAVAAYDFADISEYADGEPSYVDGLFTKLLGEERIHSLNDYFYGTGGDEFWEVQSVINSGNVSRLPNVAAYAAVIGIYILLAGPAAWILLKRHEIQGYYWGAVTMLSLVFVAVIYLMGMGTRFRSTFLTYATVRDVTEESVMETSYVNVQNPYNKPYSLKLAAGYSIRPISMNAGYGYGPGQTFTDSTKAKMTIANEADGVRLDFHEGAAFDSNYMEMKRTSDNLDQVGVTGEISFFDGKVTGTVTNQYDFALEDAAVLMYGAVLPLGDLQPGETRDLGEITRLVAPLGREQYVAARITGLDTYSQADINDADYVQAMERANLLAFYMDRELDGYRREARVTGFAKDEEGLFMGERKIEARGLNMFTSALPVYNETEEGEIYRSGLMKTPQVQSGSYDHTTNSMYGSDSLTLEYSFGNDIELDEITFNTISSDFMENQMLAPLFVFSGDIYFYNYNTGIYDKIDNDREKFEVSELLPYLSPGNTLTVKYIDTSQEDSGWDEILPMLMVKGREK